MRSLFNNAYMGDVSLAAYLVYEYDNTLTNVRPTVWPFVDQYNLGPKYQVRSTRGSVSCVLYLSK